MDNLTNSNSARRSLSCTPDAYPPADSTHANRVACVCLDIGIICVIIIIICLTIITDYIIHAERFLHLKNVSRPPWRKIEIMLLPGTVLLAFCLSSMCFVVGR